MSFIQFYTNEWEKYCVWTLLKRLKLKNEKFKCFKKFNFIQNMNRNSCRVLLNEYTAFFSCTAIFTGNWKSCRKTRFCTHPLIVFASSTALATYLELKKLNWYGLTNEENSRFSGWSPLIPTIIKRKSMNLKNFILG